MKQIDKQIGRLLFDRVQEVITNVNLTPKERIPKLRSILDDLFKTLTADAKELLSTLHARESYLFREHDIPVGVQVKTKSLRIFSNTVVHESEFVPSSVDEQRCVYQLAEILSFFSKVEIPDEIVEFYKSNLDSIKKEETIIRPQKPIYSFYAVVENIFFPRGEYENKFCSITCSTDELGTIKLKLWNNKNVNGFGSDLTSFGKIARQFSYFYATGVMQAKDKDDEYFATEKSLIVFEPDYLIDAKELSECRQRNPKIFNQYQDNPNLFIINRFNIGEITDKIMIGNIVGKVLDNLVTNPERDYKDTFASVMRENSFGMLSIAHQNGAYDKQFINKVYLRAEEHKKGIQKVIQDYRGKECIIEPTFISNKFGIQGRLDLLIDYGNQSNRKDIIELKSSENYPKLQYGLYHNHEAQALCYDLLLDSTYPDRMGASNILYSSAPTEEKPLRSVGKEKYLAIQDLLMLRNRVVANDLQFSEGNFTLLQEILLTNDFGPYPPFLENQIKDFVNTLAGLEGILKLYFFGFIKFIYKELQVAKIGSSDIYSKSNGYADLWKLSKAEKIDNYNVLVNLKIGEITSEFYLKLIYDQELFNQSNTTVISSFRVGDSAVFYPTPAPEELNPLQSQILKCRVIAITQDSVEVCLVNKQVDKKYFESNQFWALERDFRENSFKQQLALIYQFIKSEQRVIDLVLGSSQPLFKDSATLLNNDLDMSQQENVIKALKAEDYYLIQGPPGTGKTSKVLVEIVRNLAMEDPSILVLAYTNRAVDEICEKLINKNIDCIRLGQGDKPYYWSHLSNNLRLDQLSETVLKCKIFISTISTFVSSQDLLKFKNFDTLIVDEASQILESQIVGILKNFRKWIFMGDENQLPAVVLQSPEDSKCEEKLLNDISLNNFRESLFYRLKKNAVLKNWDCYGVLKYQHRMHQDVAEFSNKYFYNNLLEIASQKQKVALSLIEIKDNGFHELLNKARVIYIPTSIDKKSKTNDEEAQLTADLMEYIAKMKGDEFNPERTIGVITTFRAQIANIRNRLDRSYRDITIDTVERFQGSERDYIILSLAVKSPTQFDTIQSINDEGIDRKLNVALTRAKEQLIIMGSEAVLQKNELYNELIEFIKSKGGYIANPNKSKIIPADLY